MEYSKIHLEKLDFFQLIELSNFIIDENYAHHSNSKLPKNSQSEVLSIYDEEVNYFNNAEIYVAKNILGNIIGSIRVYKWNYNEILPLQKIFNINPLDILKPNQRNHPIWHVGRFAINKDIKDRTLFKKLMVCATAPIFESKIGFVFAECDSKLLRVMNFMGIKTNVIGPSLNYLGSETIPVCMSYDDIKDFYLKNKSLVETEFISNTASNY